MFIRLSKAANAELACVSGIDDCASSPCTSKDKLAVCVDGHLSYNCTCSEDYTRTNCELREFPEGTVLLFMAKILQ